MVNKKNVLLVEPKKSKKYHTPYPPLGLLKLASFHKKRGDRVKIVSGLSENGFEPEVIYITSLFTYAWEPVHEVIHFRNIKRDGSIFFLFLSPQPSFLSHHCFYINYILSLLFL